jgi:hypothetical protein
MTMTPVGWLATSATTLVVCCARLVARVVACALAAVVFHNGRRGCLYRFLVGFPLINRPTLFFLIN